MHMRNLRSCAAVRRLSAGLLPGARKDGAEVRALQGSSGAAEMIHYHGLPITPATAARAAVTGGHAFVSFRYPEQLGLVLDI